MKKKSTTQWVCSILFTVFFVVSVAGFTQNYISMNLSGLTDDYDKEEITEELDDALEELEDEDALEEIEAQFNTDNPSKVLKNVKSLLKNYKAMITSKGIGISQLRFLNTGKSLVSLMGSLDDVSEIGSMLGIGDSLSGLSGSLKAEFILLGILFILPLLFSLAVAVVSYFTNNKVFYIVAMVVESIGFLLNLVVGLMICSKISSAMKLWISMSGGTIGIHPGLGWYLVLLSGAGFIGCSILMLVAKNPMTASIVALIGLTGTYMGSNVAINPNEEIIIGRDSSISHLILSDKTVSRKHCGVRYDANRKMYQVIDYSSTGTQLGNGQDIPKGVYYDCTPGSIIQIGKNKFQLQ